MTFCFKAKGQPKDDAIPDWLSVEFSFAANEPRCYSIWVVPEVAEVALVLGTLEIDGSVEGWIGHLESLGFEDVVQVSCKKFFSPRADRDR
jgi:hypothetical protein